jgi:hypothetical protein
MDQIAARTLGKETQLASLEICLDANELIGACEAGYSCAYANTLSWRDETTPLPMENRPRAVFERCSATAKTPVRRRGWRGSSGRRASSIHCSRSRPLPQDDRSRRSEQAGAVSRRDSRNRAPHSEGGGTEREGTAGDGTPSGGIPGTFAEHARLMFDMQLLAYQSDMTCVVTFMLSREVSSAVALPEIGISDPTTGCRITATTRRRWPSWRS